MEKVYFDYSATTMVDKKVLDKVYDYTLNHYGNPNSNHDLGKETNKIIKESIKNICNYFKIKEDELIFTSGSSESNNMVLKGLENDGRKKIITTFLEHSSIMAPLSYLQAKGYEVEFVKLDSEGQVDLEDLKSKLDKNTLLVSICYIDSELGIKQNTGEAFKLVKDFDDSIYTHSDITQGLGKVDIDLDNIDMASFSGHKIYTFKGIGGLIKKEHVKLVPLIHGGKSTTIYRSGTPQTELIYSLSCAIDLFKETLDEKYKYISKYNKLIREELSKYDNVLINSTDKSIPNILNISFIGKDSNDTQKFFNDRGVFISTKTACSSDSKLSKTIMNFYNDEERASSSVRISLSYKTTEEEINYLFKVIKEYLGK